MKTQLLNLLTIIILITNSCKKEKDDGLTPETQTGANTFSCKINGEVFLPQQALFGPTPLSAIIDEYNGDKTLRIDAYSGDKIAKRFNINIEHFTGVKKYNMDYNVNTYSQYIYRYNYPDKISYSSKQLNDGYVSITKFDGKIVSGTFEFNVKNGSENVAVSLGRFDITLR